MTTKSELLKKVRQFCCECMGGPRASADVYPIPNPGDVKGCTAPLCIWFEYRFGKDPNPNPRRSQLGRKLSKNLTPRPRVQQKKKIVPG